MVKGIYKQKVKISGYKITKPMFEFFVFKGL